MELAASILHLFHPQRSNNHRARVLHPEAFIIYVSLAILFVAAVLFLPQLTVSTGSVLGFNSSITASQVVEQTNLQRQQQKLPPLKVNAALNEAALAKAQDMMAKQYWAHTAPDGTQPWVFFTGASYQYSVAGENLARDFRTTTDMVSAWMNSPTHKQNILHTKYEEIGVAVIDGRLHGVETTLVVQFFGTARPTPSGIPNQAAMDSIPVLSYMEEKVGEAAQLTESSRRAAVLSSMSYSLSQLSGSPLFSPLQAMKAFFLAILLLIVSTLVYDALIMQSKQTARFVGKNAAHVLFFFVIAYLILYFRSGVIS